MLLFQIFRAFLCFADAAEVPLLYRENAIKTAFYHAGNHDCSFNPSSVSLNPAELSLMAIQIDLTDSGVDVETLTSAEVSIHFFPSSNFNGHIEIYAVRSYDYNEKYVEQCRFKFMNNDIKSGPIHWGNVALVSVNKMTLPNCAPILKPFLKEKGDVWTKKVVIILKFVMVQSTTIHISKVDIGLTYIDRTPGKDMNTLSNFCFP